MLKGLRKAEGLRTAEPNDAVSLTIQRLQQTLDHLNMMCSTSRPAGCGPDMAIPI